MCVRGSIHYYGFLILHAMRIWKLKFLLDVYECHRNIKPRGICKQMMLDLLKCSPRSHTNTWVLRKWDINGVRSDHMTKTIGGVLIEI